jgi:hypothetical protein
VRRTLALLAVAAVALVASVILGEYSLTWKVGLAAGVGVGLVLTEIALTVGRTRGLLVALLVAIAGAVSLLWAGRIDSAHGLLPYPVGGWLGAVVAAAVSAWRLGRP